WDSRGFPPNHNGAQNTSCSTAGAETGQQADFFIKIIIRKLGIYGFFHLQDGVGQSGHSTCRRGNPATMWESVGSFYEKSIVPDKRNVIDNSFKESCDFWLKVRGFLTIEKNVEIQTLGFPGGFGGKL